MNQQPSLTNRKNNAPPAQQVSDSSNSQSDGQVRRRAGGVVCISAKGSFQLNSAHRQPASETGTPWWEPGTDLQIDWKDLRKPPLSSSAAALRALDHEMQVGPHKLLHYIM